jgi:hypothetical protein
VTDDQVRSNRRVINASSMQHGGARGFTKLVVSKLDGEIELDLHVTGQCVFTLFEDGAIALRRVDGVVRVSEPMESAEAYPDRPLTPGETLEKLFMDNAANGRNAANDELVAALRQRALTIQALTLPTNHDHPAPTTVGTTAQE